MIQFRIQSTPNPQARKYIVNQELKKTGKVSYKSAEECQHVPMAQALLSLAGVTQVHFYQNTVSVTQDGTVDWAQLDQQVQQAIRQLMDFHNPDFIDYLSNPVEKKYLTPELQKIDAILERTIRPGLQMDGGDLELLELENHLLTVRYLGACGGCPSSMTGTLEAIRGILKSEYDEQIEVVAL
jgi:Fe-S cluster biogenesis protein NfuA